MFKPGAAGFIPIAMVMTVVKNAIKQGTFSLALANNMGSTILYVTKNCCHGNKPVKVILKCLPCSCSDDTTNKQTLTEEALSLKKPNRGPCWPECCSVIATILAHLKHFLTFARKNTTAETVPQAYSLFQK